MNVLYTSRKLQELFCDDQVPLHANASGDGDGVPGRCCRLCGGDSNLHYFGDTYVLQGVEERYDRLLYDCFGVKVTPADCMICEWCVRALRNTERFRALVHAAFGQPLSDLSSSIATLKSTSGLKIIPKITIKPEKEEQPIKSCDSAKRREGRKKLTHNETKLKRINIPCESCRQRVHQPKNQLPLDTTVAKHRPPKYQCTLCPKKYAVARNLVLHVREAHSDCVNHLCCVCGLDLETQEKLEDHVSQHSGLHQCDECLLIFKKEKALVGHFLSHHMKSS